MPQAKTKIPEPFEVADKENFAFLRPFDELALRDYCYAIRQFYGYIRFTGLPIGRDPGKSVALDQLYVEPLLAVRRVAPEEMDELRPDAKPNSLFAALQEHHRLIVLGDPGSGKSTLVHWLADVFTSPEPHPFVSAFGRLIPIPLILRDLSLHSRITDGRLSWDSVMACFLEQNIAKSLATISSAKLISLFETGQALILLDGLDEVPHTLRKPLRDAVWEGFSKWSRCRWVLTSRVVGYEQCPFHTQPVPYAGVWSSPGAIFSEKIPVSILPADIHAETIDCLYTVDLPMPGDETILISKETIIDYHKLFDTKVAATVLYTVPFTNEQVDRFANNWYQHYEPDIHLATITASEFLLAIRSNRSTRTLARIPNLVTLMALIYRQYARLPDGRAVLYAKISEAYLESIDASRKLDFKTGPELTRQQKERWLGEVAFAMQQNREFENFAYNSTNQRNKLQLDSDDTLLIGRDKLLESLARFIQTNTPTTDKTAAENQAEKLLSVIAERSGLLLPRGSNDRFAFQHLSFQEYFAALHLRRIVLSPGWESNNNAVVNKSAMQQMAKKPMWAETLQILFETLSEQDAWPEHLATLIFGMLLDSEKEKSHSALDLSSLFLLVSISLDCHTGLSSNFRRRIWESAWSLQLPLAFTITDSLLQPSEYREEIIECGKQLASSGKIQLLSFNQIEEPDILRILEGAKIRILLLGRSGLTKKIAKALNKIPSFLHLSTMLRESEISSLLLLDEIKGLDVQLDFEASDEHQFWKVIEQLNGLSNLSIHNATKLQNLSFVVNQPRLSHLDLRGTLSLIDISALERLPNLRSVVLTFTESIVLAPLCNIPTLTDIWLESNDNREPMELARIADRVKIRLNFSQKRWFPKHKGENRNPR